MTQSSDDAYRNAGFTIATVVGDIQYDAELEENGRPACWVSGEDVGPVIRQTFTSPNTNWWSLAKSICNFPFGGIVLEGGPQGFGTIRFSPKQPAIFFGGSPPKVNLLSLAGKLPLSGEHGKVDVIPGVATFYRRQSMTLAFVTDDTAPPVVGVLDLFRNAADSDIRNEFGIGAKGHILRAIPYQQQLLTTAVDPPPITEFAHILSYATDIDVGSGPPFYGPNPGEAWRIQQRNFQGVFDGDPAFTRAQGTIATSTGELTGVPAEWRLAQRISAVYRIEISKGGCWVPFGTNEQEIGPYEPVC